jgi:hypothetical protein
MRTLISLITAVVLIVGSFTLQGCGKGDDLGKLHDSLNRVAKSLNAAAKTNRTFYESGIYGVTGSPEAITLRQKGATVIHAANEKLILALNLAKGLTTATFEAGKLAVLQALAQASGGLTTGNATFDLVLASIATLITQAVVIIEGFQSHHLKYVLPEIQSWTLEEVTI